MAKKLKRPDGSLIEEFICASFHVFRNGEYIETINDTSGGDYSGCFCFRSADNSYTKWYTRKTAPK